MKKRIPVIFILLYLFPCAIQFLINNFLPIYVNSLPFATEKTVGLVASIGAGVTVLAQLFWTNVSVYTKKKGFILSVLFILLALFSFLLSALEINLLKLMILVVCLYFCYMPHQSIIDAVVMLNNESKMKFSTIKSFGSLGYAVMGIVLWAVTPSTTGGFLVYVAVLSVLSAVCSLCLSAEKEETKKEQKGNVLNKKFVCFLVYIFLLFSASSTITTFFPVYFSTETGLAGSAGLFGLFISVATLLEWLVMVLFGKKLMDAKASRVFLLLSVCGIMRCGFIYFAPNKYVALISGIFHGLWFGILWSKKTPYIASIVPKKLLSRAEGICSVVAFGIAPFVANYVGGVISENFGIRTVFLIDMVILAVLTFMSFALNSETKTTTE